MRREGLCLQDIVEAAEAIARFVASTDRETFVGNDMLRSAVLQKLTIIGAAAARLPAEFRSDHPEVSWADIAAFRNIAVHAYFAVNWSIVWVAATQDAPALRDQVLAILEREEPQ